MKIEDLDSNFKSSREKDGELEYYSVPDSAFDLYGIYYDRKEKIFRRFPNEVAEGMIHSEWAVVLARQTSGGRLRFSTDSSVLFIEGKNDDLLKLPHMPLTGSAGFVLTENTTDGREVYVATINQEFDYSENVAAKRIEVGGDHLRYYTLYFPLYNGVSDLKIGVKHGSAVGGGRPYRDIKPILFYGSSITQGGCASRPDNMYPALISKWNDVDFINLGVSGHAKGENSMVDYFSEIDCSVFVCDYDHNAPDAEFLEKTHCGLYEKFRKKQPETPIVFISAPNVEKFDDYKNRRLIILNTYRKAISSGDKAVYFIDGEKLFCKSDRENCTVDGSHPNDLGFYRMAKYINKTICKILNGVGE